MDPFSHPDLARIGRDLRTRLDDTLDAEQEAARAAAMRRMSLRDRLILSEDRSERVLLSTADGHMYRGVVRSAHSGDNGVSVIGPLPGSGDYSFLPGNNQAGARSNITAHNGDGPETSPGPGGGHSDWSPIRPG